MKSTRNFPSPPQVSRRQMSPRLLFAFSRSIVMKKGQAYGCYHQNNICLSRIFHRSSFGRRQYALISGNLFV
ncbi:hypothetical protein Bca4012_058660 [Brassica carinata]